MYTHAKRHVHIEQLDGQLTKFNQRKFARHGFNAA